MTSGPHRIAIAGAGIAGLASAALLARAGHEVTIFDRFPVPRPVGSGLMIQPVGLGVLKRLGLGDGLTAAASPIARIHGRANGRVVLDVSYEDLRTGLVGHGIQRGVLFGLLLDAARTAGARLITDAEITAATQDAEGARLWVNGEAIDAHTLVLDCLGAFSPLCPQPSRPLPYGALFALLDWPEDGALASDRLEQRYRAASRMVGVLPVGRAAGGARKCTFFWSLRASDLHAWRAGDLDAWKDEVAALWPATLPLLEQIRRHEDLVFARYTHHTVRRPDRGRIVHLGDSHHATSPQLGQGANTALLDAASLADALSDDPDPVRAARAYASARRRHVRLYQSASRALTPLYQSQSRILPWIRDYLGAPAARIPPMPRLLARLVAGELVRPSRQHPHHTLRSGQAHGN